MVTRAEIQEAMLYALAVPDPVYATGDPPRVITYQFESAQPPDLWNSYSGWTAMTSGEMAAVRSALDLVETLINVTFVEVTGSADPDFNFGKVTLPGATAGYGGYRYSHNGSAVLAWDSFAVYDNTIDISSGQLSLILHEIGHGLGLKHPFDAPALPAAYENNKYTVMSYDPNPDTGKDSDAMMLFDILALQTRWGENDGHAAGDDVYDGPRNPTVDVIWDTGGTDTMDASARSNPVRLDLRPARFSQFDGRDDLAIAYGVRIENAVGGSGDDRLVGSNAANTLQGGAGNDRISGKQARDRLEGGEEVDRLFGEEGRDWLYGGSQRDYLDGGAGNDLLVGGGGRDTFDFAPGMDRDTVRRFQDDLDILRFTGFGSEADVLATARQEGSDVVFRLPGGDRLTVEDVLLADISDDILAL
ncbi:MAG: hypothetical protein KatS3mg118_2718 [Paracoccaceae bacterium]|nr:MAG: hypothetical protein KatS3mg118_2718 [Paracoccaceae bacterium]